MTYLTDSAAKLVKELAAFAAVELEISETHILIRATPFKAPPREKGKPTLSGNGKIVGRPEVRRSENGRRLKLYEFNGERKTMKEWADKYGVSRAAMEFRFRVNGSPETVQRRGKGDKSKIKGKVTKQ